MDEPVVKSPYDPLKPVLPAFLPDPKDGALYMMGGSLQEPLKKLPFTIPELVAASPSRSTDGILYSGKKIDTWFSVNRFTGEPRHFCFPCVNSEIQGDQLFKMLRCLFLISRCSFIN